MKLVRESIHFERGGDIKSKMGIGLPYKNPMPGLNSYVNTELEDLIEFDFGELGEAMDIARRDLMDMVLAKGMYEEFGDAVLSFGDGEYASRKDMVLKVQHEGKEKSLNVTFQASNEYVSFYATLGDPVKDSTGYSRSVKNLAKGIRKKLKGKEVTV